MEFIRKNIKFVYILVLPVYFYIVQHSILNKHTHVFSNGIVVTHSHPIDKNSDQPINQHNHSKSEIQLFCNLSLDFYFIPEQTIVDHIISENCTEYIIKDERVVFLSFGVIIDSRGPPAFQMS